MKKNTNITAEPISKEFLEGLMEDLRDELTSEIRRNVAAVQMKVDAKSLMTLGLDRLGLKVNYWERAAYAVVGFCSGIATAFLTLSL